MSIQQGNLEPQTPPSAARSLLSGNFWGRFGVPLALLAIVLLFTAASDRFLTGDNVINIFRQGAVVAIAAVGATLVLIVAGIDISQGAIMALAAVTTVVGVQDFGLPDGVAIIIGLVLAAVVGLVNGLLAEYIRIPAFIATLGTALVVRGIAFVYTEGRSIGFGRGEEVSGEFVQWLGKGFIGPIPVPVVFMILLYILAGLVMRRTLWGLHTYAIGSAERAARVAGLRVQRHRIQVYMLAGLLSGLAGVVLAGRLGSASPSIGVGAEFDILTAVVLGGTSIYGGRGNVERTLLGALFLSTLTNGLIILNVPTFYQQIAVGVVLLLALTLDRLQSR
ncbi:MAG: ABC transporter permease [Burkholderiales bacterium]|nr:ABC transporter permease [Anaerolineae bacterium]